MVIEEKVQLSRSDVARQLGISRTYVTLLIQGKRQPSSQLVGQLRKLQTIAQLPPELESACVWWGSGDLNPDALRHKILSLARLPIPTLPNRDPSANPKSCTVLTRELIDLFLASRRHGLSKLTRGFYCSCLSKAVGIELSAQVINEFLTSLPCKNGKHSYFRTLRVLCNWMVRNGLTTSNPISSVDPPKIQKRIPPSLSQIELINLLNEASCITHKAIISLLADSGMRLSEIAYVKPSDIDWSTNTITIWGKGNKQRKAPFTASTGELLHRYIPNANGNLWNMTRRGIQSMLHDYS